MWPSTVVFSGVFSSTGLKKILQYSAIEELGCHLFQIFLELCRVIWVFFCMSFLSQTINHGGPVRLTGASSYTCVLVHQPKE